MWIQLHFLSFSVFYDEIYVGRLRHSTFDTACQLWRKIYQMQTLHVELVQHILLLMPYRDFTLI